MYYTTCCDFSIDEWTYISSQTRLSSCRCTARLRIIFQCSHCPLSTTKPLPGRLEPTTRDTWMLRVLALPTGATLSPRRRAAWTTTWTNDHASRAFSSSAQETTRLCLHGTTSRTFPCTRSTGTGLLPWGASLGAQGQGAGSKASPRTRLARLEKLPRQLLRA